MASSLEVYAFASVPKTGTKSLIDGTKPRKRKRRRVYGNGQDVPIIANSRYQKIGSRAASTVGGGERLRVQPPREWFGKTDVILSKLLDSKTSLHEQRAAVLFSSVTAFDEADKNSLLRGLSDYIEKNRFAQDEAVLTVLGAAVRKYCMNMPVGFFDSTSSWFSPSTTQPVSSVFEMELSKGIHWRLTTLPFNEAIAAPELLSSLETAAGPYLYASRLVRSATAAVAMNLCIATLELGTRMGEDDRLLQFTQRMRATQNARLLRLVSRQLERDAKEVCNQSPKLAEKLNRLAACLPRT